VLGFVSARGQNNRFSLRNWRLRYKQLVILLVPILTVLVLGLLRIATELANVDEYSRTVTQVDLSAKVSALIHDIQLERDLVVGSRAAGTPPTPAVADQIRRVDAGVNRLAGAEPDIADLDQGVKDLYGKAIYGLGTLDSVRAFATSSAYPAMDTLAVYERIVGTLLQLGREVTRVSDTRAISQQANAYDAVARAKEHLAVQNSILRAAVVGGTFDGDQLSRLRSAQAKFTAALTDFDSTADPAARARYANTVAGPEVDERLRLHQIAQNRGDAGVPVDIQLDQLDAAAGETLRKAREVETASLRDIRDTAGELITVARTNAIRDGALIGAAMLIAVLFMLLVTRSLVKPLRVLRASALDVAYRQLPATVQRILADPNPVQAAKTAVEPVPVFTREETGEVARSFDVVHEQAVRMATEQALLRDNINSIFVNLARRSQGLVERLLSVIDKREQEELDPDELSRLFEIDHLATRMRRNSESLLVLSGTGLTRQVNQPVPISEVVGAAISEVEQYKRIEVASAADVSVVGRVVNELVHLIAELLDNATYFSEPPTKVVVRVRMNRAQDLVIQIVDRGVGMSPEDIAAANERLANPPIVDVAVTKRMGLHVVAQLAKKHGISVVLRANEDIDGGLIARITVPSPLVPPTSSPAAPPPPPRWRTGSPTTTTYPSYPTGPPQPSPESSKVDVGSMRYRHVDRSSAGAPVESMEETLTERLPVYESVLSRWFATEDTGPQPTSTQSTGAHARADSTWASPVDDDLRTVASILDGSDSGSTTDTGLPKRVPKSRLLPGSAGTQAPEGDQPPPRSAAAVRSRLSSYQQGVRRGRHALGGQRPPEQS
jgi:signal transduction histidine kinase